MTFNPNSITPSENFVSYVARTYGNGLQSATFWARWGAAQAAETLNYQMPTDGIRNAPPTEADGDQRGQVQILEYGYWRNTHWTSVASNHAGALKNYGDRPDLLPWLHTPDWVSDPKLALTREGAALLNQILPTVLDDGDAGLSSEQVALLRRVVALIPTEIPTKTSANTHKKTTSDTPVTIDGHVVKPGDRLLLSNAKVITVHEISWGDDIWQIYYRNDCKGYNHISVYANGVCPFDDQQDITAVVTGSL